MRNESVVPLVLNSVGTEAGLILNVSQAPAAIVDPPAVAEHVPANSHTCIELAPVLIIVTSPKLAGVAALFGALVTFASTSVVLVAAANLPMWQYKVSERVSDFDNVIRGKVSISLLAHLAFLPLGAGLNS